MKFHTSYLDLGVTAVAGGHTNPRSLARRFRFDGFDEICGPSGKIGEIEEVGADKPWWSNDLISARIILAAGGGRKV